MNKRHLQGKRHWRSITRTLLPGLLLLLVACAHHNPLAKWEPSPNYNERQPVLIVVHYTAENSVEQSLHTLSDPTAKAPVGVQYLIGKDGKIYQLVADNKRAWQAGKGRWGTIPEVNSASIGIEIDNNGHEPFPDVQIDSLIVLLRDLTTRLNIPPTQIIGHEDLAPGRKIDPGPLFPWKRLYDAGFGIWPDANVTAAPPGFDGWLAMAALGYSLDNRANALQSFRHRFRGIESQGEEFDAEDLRILYALTRPLTGQATPPQTPK